METRHVNKYSKIQTSFHIFCKCLLKALGRVALGLLM